MNPSREIAAQRSFATIETSSSVGEIGDAIGIEQRRSAFRIVPAGESPPGACRYDLCIDPANSAAADETARSLLGSLLDAADRGMLNHFRIVTGTDLLRTRSTATPRASFRFQSTAGWSVPERAAACVFPDDDRRPCTCIDGCPRPCDGACGCRACTKQAGDAECAGSGNARDGAGLACRGYCSLG